MCCSSKNRFSRLGLFLGVAAFSTLLFAFLGSTWLIIREPITLSNSNLVTSIQFKIGLWKVCPQIKKNNSTQRTDVPQPGCALIKYEGWWDDAFHANLGLWTNPDFTPAFIAKIRSCTILTGAAVILLLLGSLLALLGHCNSDNKTLIACGFFILGGLSLGTALMVFATELSETLAEIYEYRGNENYHYRYGWCFFAAGTAFVMTKVAAFLSLSGYLNRFSSVDEMVKEMVPGAERKLREVRELQPLSTEYLIKHSSPTTRIQYETDSRQPQYEQECGPLLTKTPPDVCTTNTLDFSSELNPSSIMSGVIMEHNFPVATSLAGQTIPITIKSHTALQPSVYSNYPPCKYGTMPHGPRINTTGTIHQGFLGVSDFGSSSSNSSSGYCSKSKTLQPQRQQKKCVKIETYHTQPDTGFSDFGKRSNTLNISGSAV